MFAWPVHAGSLSISIGELGEAIATMTDEPDVLQRLLLRKIQAQLSVADLSLQAGELLFSDTASNLVADSSCTRTEVRSLQTDVTLASDTRLSLTLSSIDQPIELAVDLDARVVAGGRAKQAVGFRLGSCQNLASDNFSFSAQGTLRLSLQLQLRLNPVLETSRKRIVLRPLISLDGTLVQKNIRVEVDDSLLRGVLERLLEEQIDDALDRSEVVRLIARLEQKLRVALDEQLDNGLLSIDLPDPSDAQVNELYRLLSADGDFSLSLGYLRTRRLELLTALLIGDDAQVTALLGDAAQCEAAGILQVPLAHQPLHQLDSAGCREAQIPYAVRGADAQLADELAATTAWYADAGCQRVVDYQPSSTIDYCTRFLDTGRLGNAASDIDGLQRWTLSPGTRFDIGAVSLGNKLQPFTQRVNYKTVSTEMGECALEMQIHSAVPADSRGDGSVDVNDGKRRALIAFHGGSWQRRSAGSLGIDTMATQFVNQGFVVFAPFYRLIGNAEGNMECNNATLADILADTSDAMTWVLQNAARYGASGKPVLFGQSAGGHLAGVLAVERPAEVAGAVLFYAPVDFTDFVRQLRDGEFVSPVGQKILEAVTGENLETVDVTMPLFLRNSLPARIGIDAQAASPRPVPPMFLLHGQRDSILPYNQSVRLCNALAGRPLDTPVPSPAPANPLRQILSCGDTGSTLHLIAEGEHALDLCIADELCLAGSPPSAALTGDSVEQMLAWTSTAGAQDDDADGKTDVTVDPLASVVTGSASGDIGGSAGSGGGSLSPLVLLWLMWCCLARRGTPTWRPTLQRGSWAYCTDIPHRSR